MTAGGDYFSLLLQFLGKGAEILLEVEHRTFFDRQNDLGGRFDRQGEIDPALHV